MERSKITNNIKEQENVKRLINDTSKSWVKIINNNPKDKEHLKDKLDKNINDGGQEEIDTENKKELNYNENEEWKEKQSINKDNTKDFIENLNKKKDIAIENIIKLEDKKKKIDEKIREYEKDIIESERKLFDIKGRNSYNEKQWMFLN